MNGAGNDGCIPLGKTAAEVGDFLTRSPIGLAPLPAFFSELVHAQVPYLSTLRWRDSERKTSIRADWDVGPLERLLTTVKVPPDTVRFVIRAHAEHTDTTSRRIWITALRDESEATGIAVSDNAVIIAGRPMPITRPMVMGPGALFALRTTQNFTNATRTFSLIQEFIDVPLGEWVAGPWGGA